MRTVRSLSEFKNLNKLIIDHDNYETVPDDYDFEDFICAVKEMKKLETLDLRGKIFKRLSPKRLRSLLRELPSLKQLILAINSEIASYYMEIAEQFDAEHLQVIREECGERLTRLYLITMKMKTTVDAGRSIGRDF